MAFAIADFEACPVVITVCFTTAITADMVRFRFEYCVARRQRAELEAKNWELELERMPGRAAYISPQDLSVILSVLKGCVRQISHACILLKFLSSNYQLGLCGDLQQFCTGK
jgi:hypothetical protein